MQNQTFVEFIVDMITDEHYKNITEDFKKDMFARWEVMYQRELDSAFRRGRSEGYVEGVKKGIEAYTKSLNNGK